MKSNILYISILKFKNIFIFSATGSQNSPVSPAHLHHQNGFAVATVTNPYNTGAPQWTGNNTLTYTTSMQPPDHRHLHATPYCNTKIVTSQ